MVGKQTKKRFTKRIYGYLHDMKEGEENDVALRISQDIEIYVLDLKEKVRDLELKINKKS